MMQESIKKMPLMLYPKRREASFQESFWGF
jgi:hypothetical protein